MARFEPPEETRQATNVNGLLAVLFPGQQYKRYVRSVQVQCSAKSAVAIYVGGLTLGQRKAYNRSGFSNTYSPSNLRVVAKGQPIYVVWVNASPSTATASAILSCEGEW